MSSNHFVFPPPPPAPPQSLQNYQAFNQGLAPRGGYGDRGNRGNRYHRGQRREAGRGGPRGGYRSQGLNGDADHRNNTGDDQAHNVSSLGYNGTSNTWRSKGYPSFNYPPIARHQSPADRNNVYNHQFPAYPHSGNDSNSIKLEQFNHEQKSHPFKDGQLHASPYGYGTVAQSPKPSNQSHTPRQLGGPQSLSQPIMMGSPIRIGYDVQPAGFQSQFCQSFRPNETVLYPPQANGRYHSHAQSNFPNQRGNSSGSFPGHRSRGQKRGHWEAFGRRDNSNPKTEVAPAVPSFGAPLPTAINSSKTQDQKKRTKKRRRKHNVLGLTPMAEEHESSAEEEDDVDEEAKLAAAVAQPHLQSQQLQITYKGQTSNLCSASDIASWIEERKRKFPTRARITEAAERREEAQRARREAQQKHRAQLDEHRRKQAEEQQSKKKATEKPENATAKAKRKVEKLRKQLQREEKRVARAELRAQQSDVVNAGVAESLFNSGGIPGTSKKRKRSLSPKTLTAVASVQKSAEDPNGLDPNKSNVSETLLPQGIHDASEQKQQNALNPLRDPLTPTSQPCTPYGNTIPSLKLSNEVALSREIPETPQTHMSGDRNNPSIHSTVSMLDSTSDSSSTDSDDLTSSSGSSSDDDDKSDDDAPEQSTSKRTEPEKVRAPKRTQPKQVCRAFLRTGRCKYGTRCRNLHELPKRGNQSVRAKTKDHEKQQGRKGRIGLYQRLVQQEKEQEERERLAALVELGEKEIPDSPSKENPGSASAT